MFGEGYFTISFESLLGLVVTIVGILLVVGQLRDARLASQLSGFLELSGQIVAIASSIEFIDSLGISRKWGKLDGREAYTFLTEDAENRKMYKQVAAFYETLGSLVKRGALDYQLAEQTYGGLVSSRWQVVEKAVEVHRHVLGEGLLYENWEWLANEFKK